MRNKLITVVVEASIIVGFTAVRAPVWALAISRLQGIQAC